MIYHEGEAYHVAKHTNLLNLEKENKGFFHLVLNQFLILVLELKAELKQNKGELEIVKAELNQNKGELEYVKGELRSKVK